MEDRDNVRVDLLKFRRKAYLSYPEGSPERKNFLKTVLQNELRIAEQDVPQELLNFIVEGDKVVFKDTIKQFIIRLLSAILCTVVFFLSKPLIHGFSFFYLIVGIGCLGTSIECLYDYYKYCKSINIIKKYSNDMRQHMNRISNDIKRLDGPK